MLTLVSAKISHFQQIYFHEGGQSPFHDRILDMQYVNSDFMAKPICMCTLFSKKLWFYYAIKNLTTTKIENQLWHLCCGCFFFYCIPLCTDKILYATIQLGLVTADSVVTGCEQNILSCIGLTLLVRELEKSQDDKSSY